MGAGRKYFRFRFRDLDLWYQFSYLVILEPSFMVFLKLYMHSDSNTHCQLNESRLRESSFKSIDLSDRL